MSKVWVVMCGDVEGSHLVAICATKEIAEKELFKKRDALVEEWKEMNEHEIKTHEKYRAESGIDVPVSGMYLKMIKNLSKKKYSDWDNSPHECPYLFEQEVLEPHNTERKRL